MQIGDSVLYMAELNKLWHMWPDQIWHKQIITVQLVVWLWHWVLQVVSCLCILILVVHHELLILVDRCLSPQPFCHSDTCEPAGFLDSQMWCGTPCLSQPSSHSMHQRHSQQWTKQACHWAQSPHEQPLHSKSCRRLESSSPGSAQGLWSAKSYAGLHVLPPTRSTHRYTQHTTRIQWTKHVFFFTLL